MRFISKGAEPRELINWKRANRDTPENLNYRGGGLPREAVKNALLHEQGYLCGYTMKRISSADECHIEHIIPQSKGEDGDDIRYSNMLACFPTSNSTTECEYGAKKKANYDVTSEPFVSPLDPVVKHAFIFKNDGLIEAKTPEAEATIKVLNLNCAVLRNSRAAEIRGWLRERKTGKKLSAAKARDLASKIKQPSQTGQLTAFCEAISQAASRYAEKEEHRAMRVRNIRS